MKLLQYILFEKCIYILALEMASPGNQHCTNCIGTLLFPIGNMHGRFGEDRMYSSRDMLMVTDRQIWPSQYFAVLQGAK